MIDHLLPRYLADRSALDAHDLAVLIAGLRHRLDPAGLVVRLLVVNDLLARRFSDRHDMLLAAIDRCLAPGNDSIARFVTASLDQARRLAASGEPDALAPILPVHAHQTPLPLAAS